MWRLWMRTRSFKIKKQHHKSRNSPIEIKKKKKEKKKKSETKPQCEDRLSNLPVDVVLTILSHLPIKAAVATSVLSRGWRAITAALPRLNCLRLDAADPLAVDRIRLKNTLLRRLHIRKPSSINQPLLADLFAAAAARGVRELALDNLDGPHSSFQIADLILSSKSLTVLSASACRIRSLGISFVNLKTLKLEKAILFRGVLEKIVKVCVRLETLNLVNCSVNAVCKIRSVSLKHLLIRPALSLIEMHIDTPELQTLSVYTKAPLMVFDVRAPRVKKAFLHLNQYFLRTKFMPEEFLAAATELTCLTLRGTAVRILAKIMRDRYRFSFAMLRVLSLSLNLSVEDQALFLISLLERCPQLRDLKISFTVDSDRVLQLPCLLIESSARLIESIAEHSDRLRQLPCLSKHLKKVELTGFWMHQVEEELVTILWREAKVLKKIIVKLPKEPRYDLKDKVTAVVELLSTWGGSIERIQALHSPQVIQLTLP